MVKARLKASCSYASVSTPFGILTHSWQEFQRVEHRNYVEYENDPTPEAPKAEAVVEEPKVEEVVTEEPVEAPKPKTKKKARSRRR